MRQKTEPGYFTLAAELKEKLLSGSFPPKIREQFRAMLEYFGQSPIIARSSSLLEDSFGNAFAGKYESVFCVNSGTPEERLEQFEQAVRTVYASTMDPSALEYRRRRGLDTKDEQMAILVQRVSGTTYPGKFFMPGADGVGY
ncbi:MAG: PEP/pyruvate-binding domain-containing protein, partial [Butyricicoccus porcorum]